MAGLRFIERIPTPGVFEGPTPGFLPLQAIEVVGYSACLICGVGLCISAASRHFLGFLAWAGEVHLLNVPAGDRSRIAQSIS
jgi:hypothetical protein